MKHRTKPVVAIVMLAFALISGCSKKAPGEDANATPAAASARKAGPTDWDDDAGKAAIAADSGTKKPYVCVFIYPDIGQRGTNVRTEDRPQLGLKKVSLNEESVEATSADKAHLIMESATNHSLQIGPCTADLTAASIDRSIPLSSYSILQSGLQVALVYYGLNGAALPVSDLAQNFNADYQSTTDSFRKQDLIKDIQSKYQAQQKSELASPYFLVKASAALGHYNADTRSFPILNLGMDGNSRLGLPDASFYGVVMRGDTKFQSVTLESEEKSRALEAKVAAAGDRLPVNVDVYFKAADTVSYAARKDIVAKVVAVHVADQGDSLITDIH